MLRALAILLLCQLAGETLTRTFALPVPGPVNGLVILGIVLLLLRWRLDSGLDIEKTADGILGTLGLLFVPAGVGVIQQLGLLGAYWLVIIVTLVLSTLVTLLVTVGTFVAIKRLTGARP